MGKRRRYTRKYNGLFYDIRALPPHIKYNPKTNRLSENKDYTKFQDITEKYERKKEDIEIEYERKLKDIINKKL